MYKETTGTMMKNQTQKDMNFYYEKALIEHDQLWYLGKELKRNNPKLKEHFFKVVEDLDISYLMKKLNYACDAINRKTIIVQESSQALYPIDDLIKTPSYQKNNFIKLYHAISHTLPGSEKGEEGFHRLERLLNNLKTAELEKNDLNEIYTHALNFCVRRIIEGKIEYRNNLFDLYEQLLQRKLIYKDQCLHLGRFKNIISLACQMGKTDRARELLNNHKKEIDIRHQESAYNYLIASILFYEKQFEEAIGHLIIINTTIDFFFAINTRTLLLRCYYELGGAYNRLFKHTRTTIAAFIRRNKNANKEKKALYGNFCKFAYQVYLKRKGYGKKTLTELEGIIKSTKMSHKDWILEKLAELKT